ncbi:hypothetical protein [Paenibacillus sp. FSL R7-0331]|uniref:hypothetical protein n=1 Tax=Paenibacillus sp. FSL R7-0331 TaxID=1536773 RepID=UPI0004F7C688|nr:hypothetical protein [Paenibacillus sp. FSL R7-0331]AIQ52933.1 hypothetical protein R70331_16315 [Paenibacillus sp. FSL R7-0331]
MTDILFQDKQFEKSVLTQIDSSKVRLTLEDIQQINGILITHKDTSKVYIPWYDDTWELDIPMRDDSSLLSDEDHYPWKVPMISPNLKFNVAITENGHWEQDLRHFSHIKALHLYAPTCDLRLLGDFANLEELYVVDSQTRDWSFIQNLINLRLLFLSTCDEDIDANPICELSKSHNRLSHIGVECCIDGIPLVNPVAEFIELGVNASLSNRSMRAELC